MGRNRKRVASSTLGGTSLRGGGRRDIEEMHAAAQAAAAAMPGSHLPTAMDIDRPPVMAATTRSQPPPPQAQYRHPTMHPQASFEPHPKTRKGVNPNPGHHLPTMHPGHGMAGTGGLQVMSMRKDTTSGGEGFHFAPMVRSTC